MNTSFNKKNLFYRILASPLILGLIILGYFYGAIVRFAKYLKYGGELITFTENERPTINSIYYELKDARKQK
jgi:hypothetical protein